MSSATTPDIYFLCVTAISFDTSLQVCFYLSDEKKKVWGYEYVLSYFDGMFFHQSITSNFILKSHYLAISFLTYPWKL